MTCFACESDWVARIYLRPYVTASKVSRCTISVALGAMVKRRVHAY